MKLKLTFDIDVLLPEEEEDLGIFTVLSAFSNTSNICSKFKSLTVWSAFFPAYKHVACDANDATFVMKAVTEKMEDKRANKINDLI